MVTKREEDDAADATDAGMSAATTFASESSASRAPAALVVGSNESLRATAPQAARAARGNGTDIVVLLVDLIEGLSALGTCVLRVTVQVIHQLAARFSRRLDYSEEAHDRETSSPLEVNVGNTGLISSSALSDTVSFETAPSAPLSQDAPPQESVVPSPQEIPVPPPQPIIIFPSADQVLLPAYSTPGRKVYAVLKGLRVGVFYRWIEAGYYTKGVPGSSVRSFDILRAAVEEFENARLSGMVRLLPDVHGRLRGERVLPDAHPAILAPFNQMSKWYCVTAAIRIGVFSRWTEVNHYVDQDRAAIYQSFDTYEEAQNEFKLAYDYGLVELHPDINNKLFTTSYSEARRIDCTRTCSNGYHISNSQSAWKLRARIDIHISRYSLFANFRQKFILEVHLE
ncbi:hypothetical protein DFH11DRAFT_1549956 [Phellopilus nigrolimitatus]|nr:hypothetical protein DFH11DRAFT_1549956 [Phellopilus nigrolimitatus]